MLFFGDLALLLQKLASFFCRASILDVFWDSRLLGVLHLPGFSNTEKLSNIILTETSSAGSDCSVGYHCGKWRNGLHEHHQHGPSWAGEGVMEMAGWSPGILYCLPEARPVRQLGRKALTQRTQPSWETLPGAKERPDWFGPWTLFFVPLEPRQEQALTCGTGAKSSHGVLSWDESQPGPGCGSVRRSATGAGVRRATPCGQRTGRGSSPRAHSTVGWAGGPPSRLSPALVGRSSRGLEHLGHRKHGRDAKGRRQLCLLSGQESRLAPRPSSFGAPQKRRAVYEPEDMSSNHKEWSVALTREAAKVSQLSLLALEPSRLASCLGLISDCIN